MFQMGLERDQFAEDMKLSDGSMMKIEKIYPLDATFDTQGMDPSSKFVVLLCIFTSPSCCPIDTTLLI